MTTRHLTFAILAAAVFAACAVTSPAHAELFSADKFKAYGDFRLRFESDFDSQTSSCAKRDDRARIRVRARVGFEYVPNDDYSFGARLRTGSDFSHQSPHITVLDLNDNDTGDSDFNFDKWYLRGKYENAWGWVGRNSLPFWKQNEMFWDDDVTPAGIALGWGTDTGNGELKVTGGFFSLPVGMQEFSGKLHAGQVVWSNAPAPVTLTFAGSFYAFDGKSDDPDGLLLLSGNGTRDYEIASLSAQAKLEAGGKPLMVGVDVYSNQEDYSPNDRNAFTVANRDETDGYVFSGNWGTVKKPRDWLVGYYYARLETFAVNSSYAQDDWVRWGSAVESRPSNMKGHEFRFIYGLREKLNMVARLYVVDAITTPEDGNRFRIDFNFKF